VLLSIRVRPWRDIVQSIYLVYTAIRTAIMAPSQPSEAGRSESPDPASHAANIYDAASHEGEWETDDTDDDMYEPTTHESEDAEFFDPAEDVEADFHGMAS